MNILLIGGTGLLGSYLLPKLVGDGHVVFALTRKASSIDKLRDIGARGILGDILRPEAILEAMTVKPDFLILLAMPGIRPGKRVTKKRKTALREEVNGFFRNSLELAIRYHAPIILPSGTSYHTREGETADETWPISRTGLTAIGRDTDEMVRQAIRTRTPEVIQLIFGRIYGNGGLFRFQYEMVKKNRYRIIGKGDNHMPLIHASDAADAILAAIEKKPYGEKFIIADDTTVSQKEFTHYMAALMGVRKPGSIPGPVIKILLGRDLYELIRMNCRVSNQKARKILDWKPEYTSYRTGLQQVIREMQENQPCFSQISV